MVGKSLPIEEIFFQNFVWAQILASDIRPLKPFFKKTGMPIFENDRFTRPPFGQFEGHSQTIVPSLTRKFPEIKYRRERLELPDGDFLDLDWLEKTGNRRLVILSHGLEGSSNGSYIKGMAKIFHENGWDALAWNCRSCSGEMNRLFRLYHHGDIGDLSTVVDHAIFQKKYPEICLVGFSMGGSMTLKYAGVLGEKVPAEVRAAIGFSVPCDIRAGADVLDRADNFIYKKRFLAALSTKILEKNRRFPGKLDVSKLKKVKNWLDFDEWFSAPIAGFGSADEFHAQASSKNFVAGTRIPTLLVQAINDPILTPDCWPEEIARDHEFLLLEKTKIGGHVGFMERGHASSWAERRAISFVEQQKTTAS